MARWFPLKMTEDSHCVYTGCERRDNIGPIMISDAVYTGCGAARQIPDGKLMIPSIYDVLT